MTLIGRSSERINLINRTAQWCFDNTEGWSVQNIGTGLAYLFWAIAAADTPFDATLENSGGCYEPLVDLLRKNPNGLLETLESNGFIIVDNPPELTNAEALELVLTCATQRLLTSNELPADKIRINAAIDKVNLLLENLDPE